MRVGMDISQLAHAGGVGVYTRSLADYLIKQPDLEVVFFYSSLRKPYRGDLPNVKSFPIPPALLEPLFNRLRWFGIEKFIGDVDVFHSSDWTQPPTKAKKVTTYHDVIPLKFPQWSHPKIVEVHRRRLKMVEKEVDMVMAVSESTKHDLVEVSHIPPEKITVIYEAAGDHFRPQPAEKVAEFKRKLGLPDEFILAIGGVGERRNLDRVRQACKDHHLVVAGETTPWLAEKDMPLLYSAARVLLYPSLYEGFGLPILEAMACGTPVITANISSMPEVGGEAALYVGPHQVADIREKLDTIMSDQKLRQDLIKKGFERVEKFSWEKTAKETATVYRKVVQL